MGMNNKKSNIIFDAYGIDITENENINEILDYSVVLSAIAKVLINYRKEADITQKDLAKKLNIRQSMISKLESGEYNPTLKMLLKISYKLEKNSELFLIIIENIRKTITKTKQYKELKRNLMFKNVKVINDYVYKYDEQYVFIDLSIKDKTNNDRYKYRCAVRS